MSRGLAIVPGMLGSKANKLPSSYLLSFLPSAAGGKEDGGRRAESNAVVCGTRRFHPGVSKRRKKERK